MCTTSVVLVLAVLLCCQGIHGNTTSLPGKVVSTQENTSTPLRNGVRETAAKPVLLNTAGAEKERLNNNGFANPISSDSHQTQRSSSINNDKFSQHVDTVKQSARNGVDAGDNVKAQSSLDGVGKTSSRNISSSSTSQATNTANFGSNYSLTSARKGHRNYVFGLSNTESNSTRRCPLGNGADQVSGKCVELPDSSHKVGASRSGNELNAIDLKKLNNHKKNRRVVTNMSKRKHIRRHFKYRKNKKLRKYTSHKNSVISRVNNHNTEQSVFESRPVSKKKRHHHHRHHHHRHRHHHEQSVYRKKKEQKGSKPDGGYHLAPPMMVTPKPTPTKKQPKIFKVQKQVMYTKGHVQQPAQKRFVIVGGPKGLRHLNRFHFSPALVNALKLVLNKKNSFKKDADVLNLAKALETKDTDTNIPKNNSITTAVSSGKTQNGQRARLVTVKDPGYGKVKEQKRVSNDLQVHHEKGPKALKSSLINAERSLLKNVPGLLQSLMESQRKRLQNPSGGIISKKPAPQVLGQAAYRSKISEDHAHTTLVDPTSLGISILKLLFGKRAKLVVKPKFKMLVNGRADSKYLQGYGTPKQRAELQKEIEEENKLMLLKGSHKEVFEATLAKSISNLITALNKSDKTSTSTPMQPSPNQKTAKDDNGHKTTKEDSEQSRTSSQDATPNAKGKLKNSTEEQGTRKSWVLLKMPKTGEKEDENVDKYQDKEEELKQNAMKLIATVGKHNNMMSEVSNSHKLLDDEIDSIKKPKENQEENPAKEVAPITYNLSGIKSKNELVKKPDVSSVETTLSKILKGIQDSIRELKEQRKEPAPSDNKIRVTTYKPSHTHLKSFGTSPISYTSSETLHEPTHESSQASAVAKIPDLLSAVNNLLSSETHKGPVSLPGLPSDETSQSDAARRYVSDVRASNDPLLPRPGVYDEPITSVGHSRPTPGQGPSDNVLFESDEAVATQRDTQNAVDAMKLKEDLESFAEKGLTAHNKYRALHHAPDLKWSDELATQAEKLAYEMAMKGTIEKSKLATSLNYGENVAKIAGTTFSHAGEEATNLWYGEVTNYSFSDPRITPQTDSFTQVVWKSSTKLGMGCARDLQTNDLYVVALYDPKGNEEMGLRSNVMREGQLTEDVYASIFKRHKLSHNV